MYEIMALQDDTAYRVRKEVVLNMISLSKAVG
jgi:hypothetical protein